MFVNHLTYGRGESNKWPLTKTTEDLLLKCDVHNSKTLKMFCQDHSQLCCSDCLLFNHRQCTNVALISESDKNLSVDIRQFSNKIEIIISELNKFKRSQEASIHFVEGSYSEKLQEIREVRKKLNADLDGLENSTLKELDTIRITLQTSLKKDVENCTRLKDELQQLSEAVQDLCDMSKKDIEFIASRKCLDKILESESYLKENTVTVQSSIIFQTNIDIDQYLTKQSSLGKILTFKINPNQVLTVKSKSEYYVKISSDTSQTCSINSGHVIVTDFLNCKVKLLDQHYNLSGHCDVADAPRGVCQITSSEVAVTLKDNSVQFISVSNGKLVNERKLQLPHSTVGIVHHQGALYITSGDALYHYTLTGALVQKLYDDGSERMPDGSNRMPVCICAVSPSGDRIYVTNKPQHKLITLATDGTLLSTFTDPELKQPIGLHVTPSGQVIVGGFKSHTVIQMDREERTKLATLASHKEGLPLSVCYNTSSHQIIVGMQRNNKIIVMKLK